MSDILTKILGHLLHSTTIPAQPLSERRKQSLTPQGSNWDFYQAATMTQKLGVVVPTTGDDVGDSTHELAGLTAEGSQSLVSHHPHVQVGHTAGQLDQLREPSRCWHLFKVSYTIVF